MLELLVPRLGLALLDFLWQGAAIGIAAALVLAALRDARPRARYAIACIALALCALLPLGNLVANVQGQASIAAGMTPVATAAPLAGADATSSLDSADGSPGSSPSGRWARACSPCV
jgi:hypothetical protein